MVAIEKQQGSNTGAKKFYEFPTCYIEEEIPKEVDAHKATLVAGHTSDDMESGEDEGVVMES